MHLVVDREKLPVPDAVVMAEGERILFAIPWGERVILGTTDTDYYGAIEEPTCDEADTRYVLDVVNASFPNARLTESDVVGHWAGLRPLVADPNGNPSDISRRHEISMSSPGWWDVTGGKLTTHRLMAEETVDAIVRHLQRTVQPCRTARTPLLPGNEPDPVSGILPPPVCELVVEHCCRNEWTQHLDDLMIRRTSWQHYHRNHSEVAQRVAGWMSRTLGWDDERLASELDSYTRISRVEHSLELEGTGVQ